MQISQRPSQGWISKTQRPKDIIMHPTPLKLCKNRKCFKGWFLETEEIEGFFFVVVDEVLSREKTQTHGEKWPSKLPRAALFASYKNKSEVQSLKTTYRKRNTLGRNKACFKLRPHQTSTDPWQHQTLLKQSTSTDFRGVSSRLS